jgi:hypothetical protein
LKNGVTVEVGFAGSTGGAFPQTPQKTSTERQADSTTQGAERLAVNHESARYQHDQWGLEFSRVDVAAVIPAV